MNFSDIISVAARLPDIEVSLRFDGDGHFFWDRNPMGGVGIVDFVCGRTFELFSRDVSSFTERTVMFAVQFSKGNVAGIPVLAG